MKTIKIEGRDFLLNVIVWQMKSFLLGTIMFIPDIIFGMKVSGLNLMMRTGTIPPKQI